MGTLLLIIATLLKRILEIPMYVYCSIIAWYKGELNEYRMNLAISVDQYSNGLCKYLFNQILIKKTGYKFGNIDETISSVIGKNKVDNTLTWFGAFCDWFLDVLEKEHSIKSIDNTEN